MRTLAVSHHPDSLSSDTSGRQRCVENRGFNDLSPASIIDANCKPGKLGRGLTVDTDRLASRYCSSYYTNS